MSQGPTWGDREDLAARMLEDDGEPLPLICYVTAPSWVPVWLQLAWLWVRRHVFRAGA